MKLRGWTLVFFGILLTVAPAYAQQNSNAAGQCAGASDPARCELDAGVSAYRNSRYEAAVEHFRRAIQLNANLTVAHLYLGTSLAQQYVPGVDTPENVQSGEQAVAEFATVLKQLPDNSPDKVTATQSIAALSFQMKKWDESKEYWRKVIDLAPREPEAYYSIGVIDWTLSYSARIKAYNDRGLNPVQQQLDIGTCQQLAYDHLSQVEEGMQMLVKALELRPDYDDAMAYMNLLYRESADLRCDDQAAREADLTQADKWVDQTLAVKKARAEKTQSAIMPNQ